MLIRRAITTDDLMAARHVVLYTADVDLGQQYEAESHWDLDRSAETYVDNPRNAMFVAVTDDGEVVATAATRAGGPMSPPHAPELASRYSNQRSVAQLVRVATLPGFRRRGLARRLVGACHAFVRADGDYRVIYFHADARVPAALAFCRSLPVVRVRDDRSAKPGSRLWTVHFELPLDGTLARSRDASAANARAGGDGVNAHR